MVFGNGFQPCQDFRFCFQKFRWIFPGRGTSKDMNAYPI